MKKINKAIDIKIIDERLLKELEDRRVMSVKTLLGISACAANAGVSACGALK
ncbi:hypothetical protein [Petrocella sp. FN5]|uniref:hypothetical protein n=1 Tax=Petrocella sp. FN5 TaxID=3032002 RepID=UPI0023DCA6BA|nr:hypothetical protein [Petrocella sp. FN5]MDF1617268.1 hypothetical protein [Petrocella sp. FN5]